MSLLLKPWHALCLFFAFYRDMVLSSVQVARVVLSRDAATAPRFVTVPLKSARSDAEIMLVSNYITLTPGTLTVDVSRDRRKLLVHSLVAGTESQGVRHDVREAIEPRVTRVTRR